MAAKKKKATNTDKGGLQNKESKNKPPRSTTKSTRKTSSLFKFTVLDGPKKTSFKILSKKNLIVLLLLIIVAGAYYFRSLFLVANVNGTFVSRPEFTKELEKRAGKQVLDDLITKTLITQEAAKKGVAVTSEEVAEEIENISSMLEGQGTTLDEALSLQGQTRLDLEENVSVQKTIEKLLDDKLTVSDQEIKDYFENNPEYFGEDANFDEVKESIAQQLKQEKTSAEYNSWITSLKDEANITYFLEL